MRWSVIETISEASRASSRWLWLTSSVIPISDSVVQPVNVKRSKRVHRENDSSVPSLMSARKLDRVSRLVRSWYGKKEASLAMEVATLTRSGHDRQFGRSQRSDTQFAPQYRHASMLCRRSPVDESFEKMQIRSSGGRRAMGGCVESSSSASQPLEPYDGTRPTEERESFSWFVKESSSSRAAGRSGELDEDVDDESAGRREDGRGCSMIARLYGQANAREILQLAAESWSTLL